MSLPKPLGRETLPDDELKTDRKQADKFDQWALGQKAMYLPGRFKARAMYLPYSGIIRVFKRIGYSSAGNGKGLFSPVLFMVVQYDDGKEFQSSWKYIQEADKMMDELRELHPKISLMSPAGEEKEKEKREQEERMRTKELPEEVRRNIKTLQEAKRTLEKRPGLYEKLVVSARLKRRRDLIRPAYEAVAILVLIAGAAALVGGVFVYKGGGSGMTAMLMILIGLAAMFVMANSKIIPTPKSTRKYLQNQYDKALEAMERSLRHIPDFPVPARYCHPFTCDRMIRILRQERAKDIAGAMEVLKSDLKAADSSVALSGDDYSEVVMIKPLFLVAGYR